MKQSATIEFTYAPKIKHLRQDSNVQVIYKEETIKNCFLESFMKLSDNGKREYTQQNIESVLDQVERFTLNREAVIQFQQLEKELIQELIIGFEKANPQLLVYEIFMGSKEELSFVYFNFLPVFKSQTAFPLQIGMKEALLQQGIQVDEVSDVLNEWQVLEQKRMQNEVERYKIQKITQQKQAKQAELPLEKALQEQKKDIQQSLDYELDTIQTKKNKIEHSYQQMAPTLKKTEQSLATFMNSIKELKEAIKQEEAELAEHQINLNSVSQQISEAKTNSWEVKDDQVKSAQELKNLIKKGREIIEQAKLQAIILEKIQLENQENQEKWKRAKTQLAALHAETLKKKKEYQQYLNIAKENDVYFKNEVERVEKEATDSFEKKINETIMENEELIVQRKKQDLAIKKLEKKLIETEEYTLQELEKQKKNKKVIRLTHNRKQKIELPEYENLYHKVKYLEHTWRLNQELIVRKERLTITETELTYEKEELLTLRKSTKEVELFVMMDECKTIHQRVKIRNLPFMQPKAILLSKDYELLKEKALYFDLIERENQSLERWVTSQVLQNPKENRKKKEMFSSVI